MGSVNSWTEWRDLSQPFDDMSHKEMREKAWFEVAHPLHPGQWSTKDHLKVWKELKSKNEFCGTFEEYLTSIHFLYNERVVFLEPDLLAACECTDFSQPNLGLADGTYLFILSLDRKLYVLQEGKETVDGITYFFKHTSLSHGQPVLSVGELKVEEGRLVSIVMSSGHYYPTKKEADRILVFLEEKGADLSSVPLPLPIPSKHFSPQAASAGKRAHLESILRS